MALAGLASTALLARLLSPQDLGAYFLALSVVLLGATMGSLGLYQAVVRLVAESMGRNQPGRARQVVGRIYVLGILGALTVGGAYLLFGGVLARKLFDSPGLVAVTGLVATLIVLMTLQGLLAETFRGFHDIRFATVFGGLVSGVLLATFLTLLWFVRGEASLPSVMLLVLGAHLASVTMAAWLLYRRVASLDPDGAGVETGGFKETISVSWPLWVTYLTAFALTHADLWIVGAFRSQEDVALYGAAVRLVFYVVIPLQIANLVVTPLIAELYAQGRKRELETTLRATATLAGIPAFVALACFVLLGGPILGLVFGDYYRDAAMVLALLSIGYLVNVMAGSCGVTLMMTGHQMAMMGITLVCGLFVIAGAAFVVRAYGVIGVASVAAAGQTLQNVLMLVAARAATGIWTHVGFESIPKALKTVRARF